MNPATTALTRLPHAAMTFFARPLTVRSLSVAHSFSAATVAFCCLAVLAAGVSTAAHADSRNLLPRSELKAYTTECAACHLAYPPGMLPAKSWTHMMGSLDKHYGTDASLDAATVSQIGIWLNANAGTYKRVAEAPPEDRITRSVWFERKHRRIDAQVWKHASVKSAANCMACHTQADKGNYDDDSVRFPKGLDARFRAAFMDD